MPSLANCGMLLSWSCNSLVSKHCGMNACGWELFISSTTAINTSWLIMLIFVKQGKEWHFGLAKGGGRLVALLLAGEMGMFYWVWHWWTRVACWMALGWVGAGTVSSCMAATCSSDFGNIFDHFLMMPFLTCCVFNTARKLIAALAVARAGFLEGIAQCLGKRWRLFVNHILAVLVINVLTPW